MRDIHVERPSPGLIPVISPVLHCISMTALVFLRSSFGYALLRPRSIFFALSCAVAIVLFGAPQEAHIWRRYTALCLFSSSAVCLYWLHFAVCAAREVTRSGDQDNYSGTSHALRLLKVSEEARPRFEMHLHLWGEPLFALFVALSLRIFGEIHLSKWLAFTMLCMAVKELMNYWSSIRRENIAARNREEVEEQSDLLAGKKHDESAPRAARKEGVQRQRVRSEDRSSPDSKSM
jgi:hypothetical protein